MSLMHGNPDFVNRKLEKYTRCCQSWKQESKYYSITQPVQTYRDKVRLATAHEQFEPGFKRHKIKDCVSRDNIY